MSTKTTFKRIALVAVASLGFGVLTSVTPASANAITAVATGISAATPAPTRVGQATTVRFSITHVAGTANSDTMTVTATMTSKPALSTGNVIDLATGGATTPTLNRLGATFKNGSIANGANNSADANPTISTGTMTIANGATTSFVDVVVTPDVAGSYTFLLSTGATTYVAGNPNAVVTLTTAGAPTTAAISVVGSTIAAGSDRGSILRVTLKDANGAATKLAAFESIDLTVSTGDAVFVSGGLKTLSLGTSAFASGTAYANITDATAADSNVVSLAGGGVLASTTTLATSATLTSSVASNTVTTGTEVDWQQGTGVATTGFNLASQTSLVFPSSSTSQSVSLKGLAANGTAAETTATSVKYTTVRVTDISGGITGLEGAIYDVVLSQAGAGATRTSALSVAGVLTGGHSYSVEAIGQTLTGETVLVITGAAPVGTTTGAITPGLVNAALGSTNTFTARVTDQFGVASANAAVTATVTAGRNLGKTAALASNADGFVTFTLADTGTTGTSDTITFDGPGATNPTATVTYGVATVATATLTGGNTTAGVTATTVTVNDIAAGDGAEAGAKSFTVTVRDVNGALLSGLPVVWTVSGTTAAITSTTRTGFTSSAGTNSASVYAWATGTYTVTATVGGVAATGTITFGQTAAGEERTVSATVAGPIVTAKVVDRFGNPVPGVTIYATKTGVGYFGAGVTSTSAVSNAAGTVEFVVAGGSADVTVSTINPASAAGSFGSGQTSAPKGYLGNSTTAAGLALLAITASTAGTATKDEAGVGASFDAAGVASATVTVDIPDTAAAAADAAAEATDAANAATDAANAAAEAADAATAAAQDAADAVAALSTQVTELVSALRKQITSLTNLVIKIQRKVRA
jgi:trimeric autotransporter adhesin